MAMTDGGNKPLELILGKRLQLARQKAGFTQQQLCQRANLSYSTLAKIERGAIKSPSIFTIQSIANALNISLDDLVGNNTLAVATNNRHFKSTKNGIKFVYFDVNGCLIDYFQRAFSAIANDFNISIDIIESTFWKYNNEVCLGHISIDKFNNMFSELIGQPNFNWVNYYLSAVIPMSEMQTIVLDAYKSYRIGLVTNSFPGLIETLIKNGQLPNVEYDVIIDSSVVGLIKPQTAIYQLATEKSRVHASEILLIDDTLINLAAASNYGWHTILSDISNIKESYKTIRTTLELID